MSVTQSVFANSGKTKPEPRRLPHYL